MRLQVGDKVIKDEANWIVTEFDTWGCGAGIGEIVEVKTEWIDHDNTTHPFEDEENVTAYDVRWPAGLSMHSYKELKKI